MRKQDRIANQQKGGARPEDRDQSQPSRPPREQMRGGASDELRGGGSEPQRPPRQSGKLPLPD